jgi:hypothetical protein
MARLMRLAEPVAGHRYNSNSEPSYVFSPPIAASAHLLSRGIELSPELSSPRREASAGPGLLAIAHGAQILIFAAALATGVLLFYPPLRIALTSGYSGTIREAHRWSGRGQVLLAVLLVGSWARLMVARRHGGDSDNVWRAWRLTHVIFVSGAALGLLASGIVLSSPRSFSLSLLDYSMTAHLGLTALSCAIIIGHAFLALAYPHSRLFIAPIDHPENHGDASRDQPIATDRKPT